MSINNLPKTALIDKFLPKSVIFDKADVDYKTKEEFTKYIQRITWKYKLAESTISVPKGNTVEEIQIFEILLKEKNISDKILKIMNKVIPYPILFECIYGKEVIYIMQYDKEYYKSERNQKMDFNFNGLNLNKVYEKIIAQFIDTESEKTFDELLEWNKQVEKLKIDIAKLTMQIQKEPQFNRKVQLNLELQKKKKLLENLLSHENK